MGTTIGNNCIIGANSLVKGTFPDGSVICGNPARVVQNTETMREKIDNRILKDAVRTAKAIKANKGSAPTIEEMSDAYTWLYLPRTEEMLEKYRKFFDLSGDSFIDIKESFLNSSPMFESFDEFLDYCNL